MGKYTRLFISESRKYLEAMSGTVIGLARESHEAAAVRESSRHAHSIKGMALFEEQQAVADLAFALETGFARAAV